MRVAARATSPASSSGYCRPWARLSAWSGPAWISRPQQAKARLAWCASSSWRVQTFAASAGVQQPQQHAEEEQQRPDEQDQGEAGSSSSSSAAPGPPAPAAVNSGGSASGAMQWREVWPLLRPDWPMLAACAACALVSVVSNCLVAPSMGRVIDVIGQGVAATPCQLALAVAKLGAVYIVSNVTLAAQVALSLTVAESLAARLRSELFLRLLRRDGLFFDAVRTGQMASWLGQDVEVLETTMAKLLGARGIRSAFETVGIIVVLFSLSPLLAATLLVSAPLLTPLIARLTGRIGGASKAAQAAAADVCAAADEVVENIKVVKLFGAEGRELGRFQGLVNTAHRLALTVIGLQGQLDIWSRLRNTVCVLSTLSLGTWLAFTGKTTIGTTYAFFIFSFSFAFSLGNLANTSGDMAKAAGAVARALAAMRRAGGEDGANGAAASSGQQEAAGSSSHSSSSEDTTASTSSSRGYQISADQLRGGIEFRGVSFRHPGWEGWTLSDISFTVPPGSTVALVGPSGGGKSTLASLVMGLYSPQEGDILVDGAPLQQLDMDWWRRQLGVVMQDPGLISGRVRNIIAYGRPGASDAEVEAAARAAQAHAFIQALPAGYDTLIGPKGVELSGGQRQRLAIARALLVQPRVLLFDEATSALDVETEASVARAMEEAGRGATTLIIAHRLSTVRRADRIVVVAAGRVAEQGTHEELLRQGGIYSRLVSKAQRRGQDSWASDTSGGESDAEGQAGTGKAGALAAAV